MMEFSKRSDGLYEILEDGVRKIAVKINKDRADCKAGRGGGCTFSFIPTFYAAPILIQWTGDVAFIEDENVAKLIISRNYGVSLDDSDVSAYNSKMSKDKKTAHERNDDND